MDPPRIVRRRGATFGKGIDDRTTTDGNVDGGREAEDINDHHNVGVRSQAPETFLAPLKALTEIGLIVKHTCSSDSLR